MQSRALCELGQDIEAELVELAIHQVRYPRLTDTERRGKPLQVIERRIRQAQRLHGWIMLVLI